VDVWASLMHGKVIGRFSFQKRLWLYVRTWTR
jgi:hypothetical protein